MKFKVKKNNRILKWFNTLAVGVLISVTPFYVCAAQLIPFQARLTDGAGTPVADGVYAINFAIYDTATGGTPVNGWIESHSTVSVISGVVNVLLGSITPLSDPNKDGNVSDAITFYTTDGSRYIGITIGAGQEMVPRHQLVPSFHAATADYAGSALVADDAAKLGGNLPSDYASSADVSNLINQFTGFTGLIGAFSGSCPTGWLLADGTLGTPDLRGRFLRGESTGNSTSLDFGGNDDATLVSHDHSINPPITNTSTDGNHAHSSPLYSPFGASGPIAVSAASDGSISGTINTNPAGNHNHSVDIPVFNSASVGLSATNANLPRYYEVIYCVKQ